MEARRRDQMYFTKLFKGSEQWKLCCGFPTGKLILVYQGEDHDKSWKAFKESPLVGILSSYGIVEFFEEDSPEVIRERYLEVSHLNRGREGGRYDEKGLVGLITEICDVGTNDRCEFSVYTPEELAYLEAMKEKLRAPPCQ